MSELTVRRDTGEILPTDPTGGRLVAWAQAAGAAHDLAKALASTSFIPKHFQGNPGDATAAIILGDELGLSPISALRSIYVISGQPALYARTMVALVMSHGHRIWTVEDGPTKVTVAGQRRGSEHVEQVTWTVDRARKAGYTSNRKYETDPQAMLYARAAGDVARKIAPDVLAGVPYSAEEIELAEAATVTVSRDNTPRKVSRAKPAMPEPAEPPLEDEPGEAIDDWPVTEPPYTADPQPAPAPEAISPAQLRMIGALMTKAGIADRDTALQVVEQTIGRRVESRKDLTKGEASRLIEALNDGAPS